MDPLLGGMLGSAAIGAASNIFGGITSAQGAAAANAANMQMNRDNIMAQQNLNWSNQAWQDATNLTNREFVANQNETNYLWTTQINEKNRDFQRETNAWNAEQVQKQMDFQERMSGTAYQRAMADMKAAGLNPILAYQQGGASSMPGASAVGIAPKYTPPTAQAAHYEAFRGQPGLNTFPAVNTQEAFGRAIGSAVTSAFDAVRGYQSIDRMKAETELAHRKGGLTTSLALQADQQTENLKAQLGLTGAQTTLTGAQTGLAGAEAARARAQTGLTDEQAKTELARRNNLIQQTSTEIERTAKTQAEIDQVKMITNVLKNEGIVKAREAADAARHGSRLTPGTFERVMRYLGDLSDEISGTKQKLPDPPKLPQLPHIDLSGPDAPVHY